MTLIVSIVGIAIALAAIAEMTIEAFKRRVNTAFYEGFAEGREAGIAEAGRLANVVAFNRMGRTR